MRRKLFRLRKLSGPEFEADGAVGCGGVDGAAVLGDDDATLGDEMAGCGAGWFHEGLPGVRRAAGGCDLSCGFGGADGFARAAGGEQGQDRFFDSGIERLHPGQ
jgi:hypothetical protein